jgi:hypothetical protein
MLRARSLLVLLLSALVWSCASTPEESAGSGEGAGVDPLMPNQEARAQRTTVRVDNQAFNDMTIYVVRGGSRQRIGQVTGATTSLLTIPESFVGGGATLQFQADPVGSNRAPISESINVNPGDEVRLTIPPG